MRILFLSHYFLPEVNAPASRTYEHCKQWVQDGHEVTVVTCAPNHPRGIVYEGYRNKLFQREVKRWHSGRSRMDLCYGKRGLSETDTELPVLYGCGSAGRAIPLQAIDVVLSTSPQFFNGLAGYLVSRLKRAPWILEIRDLWPESIVAVGAITNRPCNSLCSKASNCLPIARRIIW